ncbi:hypothetical protein FBALC1_08668 [Flavobacteriales bacterium ALC-1]|nr:hypothetical protein FBALC1_08668 [Flavobacteriales bacterium ALC-1]
MLNTKMKQRFFGYLNTPFISSSESIYGLNPFHLQNQKSYSFYQNSFTAKRLGKLAEQFVCYQLQQDEGIQLLGSNIQINKGKQTIGEMDALLLKENQPIHLEIIYKFYLYDTLNDYSDPLAYWVGPNRKDALLYKLHKLKSKQFPLLHNKLTHRYLEKHNLNLEEIVQQICFKAQLFLPYNFSEIDIKPLNKDCIAGFYISFNKFSILKEYRFYVPNKLDWLTLPHNAVEWLSLEEVKTNIEKQINKNRSPLVWLKVNATEFKKCFITFW